MNQGDTFSDVQFEINICYHLIFKKTAFINNWQSMEQEVLDEMMTADLWICYLEPFPFIYTAFTKAFFILNIGTSSVKLL